MPSDSDKVTVTLTATGDDAAAKLAALARRPLTTDDAIDAALAALASARPDARLAEPKFWRYADHIDAPCAGTAGWELRMLVIYSDVRDYPTPAELARTRRAEQLEVIKAWRKAFYDERRPRPSDVARPSTRFLGPELAVADGAKVDGACLGCGHLRHEGRQCEDYAADSTGHSKRCGCVR